MDAERFDGLVRHFASSTTTRRTGLRLLPAALAAALGIRGSETGAKKHHKKNNKKKDKKNDKAECQGDQDCNSHYGPGLNCVNGKCVCKQGGNCTGCCKSSTKCILKENQTYDGCGLGGKTCESCNPYVGCDRDLGTCVCTGSTCPGCCWDNLKRCNYSGTDNTQCGKHINCQNCTTDGRICQYNGTCCVPLGGACSDSPTRHCCAVAGVSCVDNVCKNI